MSASSTIALVDNTSPTHAPNDGEGLRHSVGGFHPLSKKLTRESVREGLARRKYAKWRRDRFNDMESAHPPQRASSTSRHQSAERAGNYPRGRSREPIEQTGDECDNDRRMSPTSPGSETIQLSEIDILYENQRGWWFFGIPLYSANSLLNFDPSAWITGNFEDSPVNITNAQVPDPSWEWAWKTWYIDMSYDVDEEGWQYSLAFASRFAWHGTHPWFHSFVRRRRWLRERVKSRAREDVVVQIHLPNDDSSTIHATSRRGGEASVGPENPPAGYLSRMANREEGADPAADEPGDILTLINRLRDSTVDRERIDAVKQFIDEGGEALFRLPEKVSPNATKSPNLSITNFLKIPEIMSTFIFHTSRGQLLDLLLGVIDSITQSPADEETTKKRDSLLNAVTAAEDYLSELEWWIDNNDVPNRGQILFDDIAESSAGVSGIRHPRPRTDGFSATIEIKGIPEEAHIGMDDGDIL